MIDTTDRGHPPSIPELSAYIANRTFDGLCALMDSEYHAACSIEYSGDNALPGWNVRFQKAGRTLCRLYPRKGRFSMLLVVGRKEKQRVGTLLPSLSDAFVRIYNDTQEGMGQRWLLLDIAEPDALYRDAFQIIRIRRESR